MTFNSYEFTFIFLPIAVTIFYTISRFRTDLAEVWLIIASLFFYGSLSPRALPLLVVSVCVNYALSLQLARSSAKTFWLSLGLAGNFCLLGWFKFTGSLPLGISFYTFTQTAYLIDVLRGSAGALSFLEYAGHITFFGCITSGPIARISETRPSFSPDYDAVAKGVTLFFIGLFKKVYIADTLAKTVNTLFAASGALNFTEAWLAVLGYTMQLYFDFSGYSDMAVGAGLMFGMTLPQNFDSPYKSLSIIDFWRRWHMSLGLWVRDYLYIPLGGSREGELKRTRNVMLAMLFTGLWHGAGWTFLVWGAVHGVMLAVNHWWRKHGVKLPVILSWVMTFMCVMMCWVVFRAESLSDAGRIFAAMIDVKNIALPLPFERYFGFLKPMGISFMPFIIQGGKEFGLSSLLVLVTFLTAVLAPNTRQIMERFRPGRVWLAAVVILAVMSFMNFSGVSDFLYFQF